MSCCLHFLVLTCIVCVHGTNFVSVLLLMLFHILFVFIRRGPGQEYVKSSLGSVIEKLVGMNNPLELHPIKVTTALLEYLIMFCIT